MKGWQVKGFASEHDPGDFMDSAAKIGGLHELFGGKDGAVEGVNYIGHAIDTHPLPFAYDFRDGCNGPVKPTVFVGIGGEGQHLLNLREIAGIACSLLKEIGKFHGCKLISLIQLVCE